MVVTLQPFLIQSTRILSKKQQKNTSNLAHISRNHEIVVSLQAVMGNQQASPILALQQQHLVCLRNHSQVIMRERPMRESTYQQPFFSLLNWIRYSRFLPNTLRTIIDAPLHISFIVYISIAKVRKKNQIEESFAVTRFMYFKNHTIRHCRSPMQT